jgi:hypothetical protein
MNFIFFKINVNRLEVKKIIIKMVARLATENDVVFRNFKRVKEERRSMCNGWQKLASLPSQWK